MLKYLRDRNAKRKIQKALAGYSLPSFPALVTQVLDQIRDPAATAGSIAEVVALDPGLSVKILKTVNSAAFSPRRPVESLSQGVVMLGMSNLEAIVFGIAVNDALPTTGAFDSSSFWLTAARRAALAKSLAQVLHPASRGVSFTAGMLQDMAVPLIASSRADRYGPILRAYNAGRGDLTAFERKYLGFDHAQAAGWLCTEWDLPDTLAAAIVGHHHPIGEFEGCPPAVALVSSIRDGEEAEAVTARIAANPAAAPIGEARLLDMAEGAWAGAEELAGALG